MFHGSIPDDVRRILHQLVEGWRCEDVYVGCSGNFTVERVLAETGRFRLHGNDVTLYSSVLGWYLSGAEIPVTVKPEAAAEFDWLAETMSGRQETTATVMLATQLTDSLSSKGELKDVEYWRRMVAGYRRQWPELHARTVAKLQGLKLALASYYCGDVVEWVSAIPREAGFVTYPPFYGGDYEAMFAKLDFLFDWPAPSYTLLDESRKEAFLAAVMDRPHWVVGVNRRLPEHSQHLRGMAQTTNRGVPLYLYASEGPKRIATPRQKTEPVTVPRLLPGEEIGERMTLAPLSEGQFHSLRSLYMNVYIRPGQATLPIGVLVDGVLVGVYAFSTAPHAGAFADPARIYLLSDFAVAPTEYGRLSKLVLYATLSTESRLLAERAARRRIRTVLTTAFSDRPVSMKYRGLFKLHSRVENPDWQDADRTQHDQQRYRLNYVSEAGRWSLAEGLREWKKKHGERQREGDGNADH